MQFPLKEYYVIRKKSASVLIKRISMRLFTLLFMIMTCNFSYGQHPQFCTNFPGFKNYVFGIVEDSSDYWSEYPKPPRVTDSVLMYMEREITGDDSAKLYLEKLSFAKYKSSIDQENTFSYFNRMGYDYSLLVLTAHWNPDIREYAVMHLNKKLAARPLVNSRKMKNGEWERFDKIAAGFLLYLLESNPLFINGSENATIHGIYISNIIWNLDILTHKNTVQKRSFNEWYKNDKQFKQAILKWKECLK